MTIINVFIPRILYNISEMDINQAFYEMNIGVVTYIDLHTRVNEMNYRYSFAFMTIQLFESEMARNILHKLNQYGRAHIPYDDRNYWEIKYFIPKEKRGCVADASSQQQPITEIALIKEEEYEQGAKIDIITETYENEPEWLNDNCDDWKVDIIDSSPDESTMASFFEDNDVSQLCIELLKTHEEREREKEFDDLQREINKTVFTNRVVSFVW
jgi:hypothetical protein